MLVVLDGFGLAPPGPGNAVHLARTPNFDRYWANFPHTQLQASGRAVGLPEGQMGNSEVGHMNLGAGRVVMQSLTYIDYLIETGGFYENQVLRDCCMNAKTVHLMGLVSRGGVHSELSHVFALMELAHRCGKRDLVVHAFTDGRDTPPDSGLEYVRALEEKAATYGYRVATVIGRYYAMDRDQRWDRVVRAYEAIVAGVAGHRASSAVEAVRMAYDRGETDEFILPTLVGEGAPLADGDGVIFFNFRADRGRQLSWALLSEEWPAFPRSRVARGLHYVSMMQYDEKLDRPFAFALPELNQCLAEVLSGYGKTQYHTAETEKYPHVTYFFNAAIEATFPGETRQMVPSPKVATYDLQPQMSAPELTALTLARLQSADDDFVLINFANPDMVGHTGVLSAAIRACEAADEGLGVLVDAVLAKGGAALILADHGNAEVMIDADGGPHTAHTTNPVPFIVVGGPPGLEVEPGVLGDVAPTVLELMGLPKPDAMTGRSLVKIILDTPH